MFPSDILRTVWVGLVVLIVATHAPAQTQSPATPVWTLSFVESPRLVKGFRQFELSRPDGSHQVAFLAAKDGAAVRRLPLLIFIDGSGAHSHFVELNGKMYVGIFGSISRKTRDGYHVVAVEKRGVTSGEKGSGGSAEHASAEYVHYATLQYRVDEIRLLLHALLEQSAVDASRVLLLGHSEGADVAAGVAAVEPRVTHVAFLSGGGATQLFDLIILQRKMLAKQGADAKEIESAVRNLEADFRRIYADPSSETKFFMGHAYKRWSSFCSHPPIDALLKTRAKLFLAHGSEDMSSPIESFDFLVAELIRTGRNDVTIRRYAGRDHGLSAAGKEGGPPIVDILDRILKWADQS